MRPPNLKAPSVHELGPFEESADDTGSIFVSETAAEFQERFAALEEQNRELDAKLAGLFD